MAIAKGNLAMESLMGIILLVLVWWALGKLAEHVEERHFLLWLVCYLAAGSLGIMILYAASHAGR